MINTLVFLLTISLSISSALADEQVDQIRIQAERSEKRLEALEKVSKQTVDKVSEMRTQVSELASTSKSHQTQLLDLSRKAHSLESGQETLGGSIDKLSEDTEQKTEVIHQTISRQSEWYLSAISVVMLLLGVTYWYLRRRSDASELSLTAQVQSALSSVRSTEEKIAKSDMALADSLFEILNKLKVRDLDYTATQQGPLAEPDHNLPLKLADEIHRMRKRLAILPDDTKGLTPLQKSLERLESELTEHGYEIVDHSGMTYSENLSVKARFVPNDEFRPDQKVITKVITPQVNYKGVMIRMADIEVSIGS